MPKSEGGLGLIRGDIPLARYIFRDARQRRLIPRLAGEGWPIFEVCGKRAARPADLDAVIAERARAARERKTSTDA
jgi:hypothetical protein